MSDEVKISEKGTWFSGQLVVYIVSLAILTATSWVGFSNAVGRLSGQVASIQSELEVVQLTVADLTIEQRIRNELEKVGLMDRWSATMQIELQEHWFELMASKGMEVKQSDRPDIRIIQRKHMPQLYGD